MFTPRSSDSRIISFSVVGVPAPKGSSRAMMVGAAAVNVPSGSEANRQKLVTWAAEVTNRAVEAMDGRPPFVDTPLSLRVIFRFARPKKHFTKAGLRPDAPRYHTQKPDLGKLVRSTEDAMTGIVYDDDSRIAHINISKFWCNIGEKPGADIIIEPR
jgi:Holliday junction resolvase RusA-like endonuclease